MKIASVTVRVDLAGDVRAAVESAGHELIPCSSLTEARGSRAALIIAEWPEGPQLAGLLRDLNAETGEGSAPVVVVVTRGHIGAMHRARAAGAADVLFCPLDPAEIQAEIVEALADPQAFDPILLQAYEALRRESLVGESPAFLKCLKELKQAARCDANVLILGETGTGKEMFARGIHRLSRRAGNPYMAVNCASLPPALLEGELFGHVKGAFTDAKEDRMGRFEAVGAGTLLLDEIGDIGVPLQVKLLRVIEERQFTRIGENKARSFNARLICATAVDLEAAVSQGRFRPDLLGRINQFRIAVPPLRERPADVPSLAWHFLQKHARGRRVNVSSSAMRILESYDFPMNIRQLENAIVEALARSDPGEMILPKHLPKDLVAPTEHRRLEDGRTIHIAGRLAYAEAREHACREIDRLYLPALLQKHHNNQSHAAMEAGIDRKTFASRLSDALQTDEDTPDA